MGDTAVKSYWSSGNLIFTEDVVGNGASIQFGVNDDGLDVKFFGATSGYYMLWDESANNLVFVGGGIAFTTTGAISMGAVSSSADGSGVALSASKTSALSICADTGSAALAASSTRAARFRYLIGTTPGTGDISAYGAESLLKFIASTNTGGNIGGVLGHLESQGTVTLTGSINTVRAGVASFLDLAANATVAASTVVSAFGVNPANFGTTMNGRSAIIHVTNPMAGTWGSFLDMSSATGLTQDSAAGATGDKFLKVYLNGVLYTIAMARA